jgi:hypothetical protein
VTLDARVPGTFRFPIHGIVGGGPSVFIGAIARVEVPTLTASVNTLAFGDVHKNVAISSSFVLHNSGALPATFTLAGSTQLASSVKVVASAHTLKPGQAADVSVELMGLAAGELHGSVVVTISGTVEPLVVPLSARVVGLQIAVCASSVPEASAVEKLALLTSTRQPTTITVYVHNLTPMSARLDCDVETFVASSSSSSINVTSGSVAATATNAKSIKGTQASSTTLAQTRAPPGPAAVTSLRRDLTLKTQSKSSRGLVLSVEPSVLELPPNAIVPVNITAIADIWGSFGDTLALTGSDLAVRVPIQVRVAGCPLEAQLTAAGIASPMLHLPGTIVGAPVSRALVLRNASPFKVAMHWQSFLTDTSDAQLVDLVPRVDESGHVSLRSRLHEGEQHGCPFSVTPEVAEFLPQASQSFTVTFNPSTTGPAHGFLRAIVSQIGTTAQPLQLSPVVFEESAGITEEDASLQVFVDSTSVGASLTFEVAGLGPGLDFEAQLVRFLDRAVVQRKHVLLRNPTRAPLACTLSVTPPFQLIDPSLIAAEGACVLPPAGALTVGVACAFVAEPWLRRFGMCESSVPSTVIDGALTATIAAHEERVPLRATAHRGLLQAPAEVRFGAVLVGSTAIRHVRVSNMGGSAVPLTLAAQAPFACIPACSTLDAFLTNVSENRYAFCFCFSLSHK